MEKWYWICLNNWLEDDTIKNELRLLIKISSLTAEKWYCRANNEYFSKYFNETPQTISVKINKLKEKWYINIEYKNRGCEIVSRKIRLRKILKIIL